MFVPMTWSEYYRHYLAQLQLIYSVGEAAAITGLLFENKAAITRKDIFIYPDKIITPAQQNTLDTALQQLLTHQPVQQIIGSAWFYNLPFAVNENVLIPRPETEELVKWILDENAGDISMLDIGSGSGCIAVTIKKHLPQARITSIDVSREALLVAKQNALSNNVTIDFLQLDFLDTAQWEQLPPYDVIVSNPPYIPLFEKNTMGRNVTAHEPATALFVPDDTPLLFYEKIAAFTKTHLKKHGSLYVEIHEDFGKETAAIFSLIFSQVEIRKDINGKDRMIKATHFR